MPKIQQKPQRQPKSALEDLLAKLVKQEKQIRAWEEENEEVFAHWREMTTEREGLMEAIKTEARKLSKPGDTRVLAESADLFVSVQGRMSPLEYDFSKAALTWPKEVLSKVTINQIDTKKVAGFIEAGILEQDLAEEVALPRTPATPAVTIKLP